jgi:acetate kinase
MPGVPQVAVFDTAFHATMPDYAYTYALPYEFYLDYGLRRYGFHGTSHRYVSDKAVKMLGKLGHDPAKTKVVTCHLGNGSSMAAIVGGKVVDTSMGVTPAEGLVMGTRAGDIDPSILPYLQKKLGLSPEDADDLINKKSGFLGVSGVSADMRDIKAAAADGNKRAQLVLNIFWYRIRKYVGSYAAAMDGLDAIVFTGGIGENSVVTRQRVCDKLGVLGVELDYEKNNHLRGPVDLSTSRSRVRVFLIPTNEEVVIARETVQVVGG